MYDQTKDPHRLSYHTLLLANAEKEKRLKKYLLSMPIIHQILMFSGSSSTSSSSSSVVRESAFLLGLSS